MPTKKESVDSSTREEHKEGPNKTEECTELVTNKEESVDSPTREERKESPNNEECEELVTNKDESIDSSTREEGSKESPKKKEETTESPSEEEKYEEWPTTKEVRLPETISAWKDPSIKGEESSQSAIEEEEECKISHKNGGVRRVAHEKRSACMVKIRQICCRMELRKLVFKFIYTHTHIYVRI